MSFNVASEIGQLRQVIVQRPGLELSRLTPRNVGELLFDDVLWAKKAKEEHDVFAEALRDKGVRVRYYGQLLAETLELPEGRGFVLDQVCTEQNLGPSLVSPLRRLFEDIDGTALAEFLIGGVLKADLHPQRPRSLRWDMLRADDFLLPPLPNHLFQRDNDVAAVEHDYGTPSAGPIHRARAAELRSGQFAAGSMGPKVEAAWRFAESTGHVAAIGRLEDAPGLLDGTRGTIVLR